MREALFKGSLKMPGKGFNGVTPPQEVARNTAIFNKPEELEVRFLGDNPRTLLKAPLSNGSEIRLHQSTGPYTPYHYMMFVQGTDFEEKPKHTPMDAELLTDHPFETQVAYWELLHKGLEGYREVLGSDYRVFSGGNWIKNYSNYEERTARTIGFHHDHLMAVKKEFFSPYIDNGVSGIQGFDQERAITNRLMPKVLPRIQGMLGDASTLRLEPRSELPYGYSFQVPAEADMEIFTRLMQHHHEAYSAVATTVAYRHGLRGASLLSQPSYNLYLELDEKGDRHVTISPSFAGPVGVLESAGIQSKRSSDSPHLVDPKEAEQTQREVVGKVYDNANLPNLELPNAMLVG